MQKTKKLLTIGITAIVFVWMLAMMPAPSSADIIIVLPGESIQDAIDTAADTAGGGTVQVAPGTYTESITMKPGVTIQGSGADVTTIEGNGISPTIAGADNSTISGFTITGGTSGIYNQSSSPVITNNIITGNSWDGIYNDLGASPKITNNIITGNDYGIFNNSLSVPTITNNTITGNNDSGIINFVSSPPITNNIITNNVVYGISNVMSSPTITYNDFWGNETDIFNNFSSPEVSDNILANPDFVNMFEFTDLTALPGATTTIYVNGASIYEVGDVYFEYNNDGVARKITAIDENTNMITFSPALDSNSEVDKIIYYWGTNTNVQEDFHLKLGSPCIDAGTNDPDNNTETNDLPETDFDGNDRIIDGDGDDGAVVDMGAFEYSITGDVNAVIDIDPDTLNLKSRGKWITAYIKLAEGYSVEDIDIDTVTLQPGEDEVTAEWGDVQEDVLMVKFDRSEVQQAILELGDEVEMTVTGKLSDGTAFEGRDTIRVIDKGNNKEKNKGKK